MSALVTFLKVRISEEEADNRERAALEDDDRGGWAIEYSQRVLAECAAKRQVIALHEAFGRQPESEARAMWHATGATLKILATVYNEHADYLEEWA